MPYIFLNQMISIIRTITLYHISRFKWWGVGPWIKIELKLCYRINTARLHWSF